MNKDMDKAALRRAMREKRRALAPQEQDEASRLVLAQLKDFAPYNSARCVMAYAACRGELDLSPVMADVLAAGGTLALPRCEAPGVMTARRVTGEEDLCPGAYGLMEPRESCPILSPQEIGLILVPGTAFDLLGGRVGQGGGYYDRFLRGTDALRVGVCHGFALLAHVPGEAHDERMHKILTPQGIIDCAQEHERRTQDESRDES